VTVLFADAVGSTSIAETLGEEEMYGLMQEALTHMVDAAREYGGHVASFTGDGLMAVFGAPVATEQSERRAVTAALRMQQVLERFAAEVKTRHAVGFRFRLGLNTGSAVVGRVSNELDMELTAVGDTVNLAARMQQSADPGSIYITESTYRAVVEHFDCQPLGPIEVKGKRAPIFAWQVMREKPSRSRIETAVTKGLAPFVGRRDHLAALEKHLAEVSAGRGHLVFVTGDAGVGKSRLLLEFRKRAASKVTWLQTECMSIGQTVPFFPVIDLLKQAFSITAGDDDDRIVQRVAAATAHWDDEARSTVPFLRYVLSVDSGDAQLGALDPRERRVGIVDAFRALLQQEAAESVVVVVVEDVQWIDGPSEEALAAVIDALSPMPVLLLLSYRPGSAHRMTRPGATQLIVDPLGDEGRAALITAILGTGQVPPEVHSVVAAAEGNPFYTEEILRSLIETGVLATAGGDYIVTRPLRDVPVPRTVQEVILSRIDRLEGPTKVALQRASVIGRRFAARLLERISPDDANLERSLTELKDRELIYEAARSPELTYRFNHALTQEVAYATLLTERRRTLHRAVASAVNDLHADRIAEHYETLAHHYFEGRVWDKAVDYLAKSASKAAAAFANQDALEYYRLALEACSQQGETASTKIADLAHRRAFVNFALGRLSAASADIQLAIDTSRGLGDRHLEGIALAHRGLFEFYNHQDSAEPTLRAASALADERDDELRATTALYLGLFCNVKGRHRETDDYFRFVRDHEAALRDPSTRHFWAFVDSRHTLWQGHLDVALQKATHVPPAGDASTVPRLRSRWNEAHARATMGDYERALRILEETIAQAQRIGDRLTWLRCLNTVGYVYGELGDTSEAIRWNRLGLEAVLATKAPVSEVEMNARLNLAENLLAERDLDGAEEHFRIVEADVRHPDIVWMHWRYGERFFHSFGEWSLARGDPIGALTSADECLASAERSGSRKNIVKARRLRGHVRLAAGHLDDADAELAVALSVAAQVGSPPQIWRTQAVLGALRRAQGRPQDARQLYDDALSVVAGVASRLRDERLRSTLLHSREVQQIRRAATAS
jgi:class 3 adenylate cyclase/tetratricopeptide (TPR) repeat protein